VKTAAIEKRPMTPTRCAWPGDDPLYVRYHDTEWGVPLHDDRRLFEFLVLEGAQAGLSWITVLRKRENYRRAFDGFDPQRVAGYGGDKIEALGADPGLIRNRLKIASAVRNASVCIDIQREFGSFDAYLWRFVGGRPKHNRWRSLREIPSQTAESQALSKDLIRRGCSFVGPTICYAFMQAVGMVNDHVLDCFRHAQIAAIAPDE
jgi:DNA-3-methyladenine glycosylase I